MPIPFNPEDEPLVNSEADCIALFKAARTPADLEAAQRAAARFRNVPYKPDDDRKPL